MKVQKYPLQMNSLLSMNSTNPPYKQFEFHKSPKYIQLLLCKLAKIFSVAFAVTFLYIILVLWIHVLKLP